MAHTSSTTTNTKFAGLVLWLLFTTVVALRDSKEHDKQEEKTSTLTNWNWFAGTGKDVVHQDNVVDDVPTMAALSNKGIQGRKMLVNDVIKKEQQLAVKEEEGLSTDGSSLKSGKVKSASIKSFEASSQNRNMNNQVKGSMEKGSEPALDEFMNMMQKDYKGLKPRRKPPINNNHPLDDYRSPTRKPPVHNNHPLDDYSPHTPTNNYEPMDDYHTPRPHPPSPTTDRPINDNGKGKHRSRPPINNHEPLLNDDDDNDNVDGDAKP